MGKYSDRMEQLQLDEDLKNDMNENPQNYLSLDIAMIKYFFKPMSKAVMERDEIEKLGETISMAWQSEVIDEVERIIVEFAEKYEIYPTITCDIAGVGNIGKSARDSQVLSITADMLSGKNPMQQISELLK